MSFLSRIVRRVYRSARVSFYRHISTAKVEGKFCAVSPVLCDGKGKVCVGKGVTFGFIQDADFWTSSTFLNPVTMPVFPPGRSSLTNSTR